MYSPKVVSPTEQEVGLGVECGTHFAQPAVATGTLEAVFVPILVKCFQQITFCYLFLTTGTFLPLVCHNSGCFLWNLHGAWNCKRQNASLSPLPETEPDHWSKIETETGGYGHCEKGCLWRVSASIWLFFMDFSVLQGEKRHSLKGLTYKLYFSFFQLAITFWDLLHSDIVLNVPSWNKYLYVFKMDA